MSETMRGAIFVGDGRVEVREFPRPKPQGTQVLVQMKASGLCGSDMHSYRRPAAFWAEAPIIRGHEPAGVIAAVGDAVSMVKLGDRVSVYHAPACGHCEPCVNGVYFNCTTIGPGFRLASMKVHGADADYLLVDQNVCFPLPDQLSFEDGAIIACAGGTAYHACRKADIRSGDYVLVSGLGPVGLCAVQVANAMGAAVIGSDPVEYRRKQAQKFGALYVIDPVEQNMPEEVKQITGQGAEVAIETSGNDRARAELLEATQYSAKLLYVGIGGREKIVGLGPQLGDRWISGSNMFTGADYYALVRLMQRAGFSFSDLVTHRFPLERAQEAFDLFAAQQTGKVMFVWD
jgi:propanol-preferring alcohol dehydrogenase